MRAFYRIPLPFPALDPVPGALLFADETTVWVLTEESPSAIAEAQGGILLGHRLSELEPEDRAACADPETGNPRTIFAGDLVEDLL